MRIMIRLIISANGVKHMLYVSHNVDFSNLPTPTEVSDRPFLFTLNSVIFHRGSRDTATVVEGGHVSDSRGFISSQLSGRRHGSE